MEMQPKTFRVRKQRSEGMVYHPFHNPSPSSPYLSDRITKGVRLLQDGLSRPPTTVDRPWVSRDAESTSATAENEPESLGSTASHHHHHHHHPHWEIEEIWDVREIREIWEIYKEDEKQKKS